jgi:hypothetical protein
MPKKKPYSTPKSKRNLWERISKTILHSKGYYKFVYKKRPIERVEEIVRGNYPKRGLFYRHGELIKIERKIPEKGIMDYWHLKIIAELFPKNVPKVHAVEPLMKNGEIIGYIMHMEEAKMNPELRNYMNTMNVSKTHNRKDSDYIAHAEKIRDNLKVERVITHMSEWGIDVKSNIGPNGIERGGNTSNISIANSNQPIFLNQKFILKILLNIN